MRREGRKGKLPSNRSVSRAYQTRHLYGEDDLAEFRRISQVDETCVFVSGNSSMVRHDAWKHTPAPTRTEKRTRHRIATTPMSAGTAETNTRRIHAQSERDRRRCEKKAKKSGLMQTATCE